MTRRGLLAAAAVVGFDLAARHWVTAETAHAAGQFDGVPALDGRLFLDAATRAAHAVDRGSIVRRTPGAVLRPGSVRDIQRMVAFCAKRGISVSPQGQSHTTHGQSLTDGLAIDMLAMKKVYEIRTDAIVADAGVEWRDLVEQTFAHGLAPRAMTAYLRLTIGGVLAVGGVSTTNGHGLVIDQVRELEVVDGTGRLHTCSATHNSDLFNAVLGGVGQFGIVVRATIELGRASPKVRQWKLFHTSNAAHFHDTKTLVRRGELDDVYTEWTPGTTGPLRQFSPAKFFDPGNEPSTAQYMRGLSFPWFTYVPQDYNYLDYVQRVDDQFEVIIATGWDKLVKPWFDVFLPESTVEQFVEEALPQLVPEVIGQGFVLLFTHRRSKARNPLYPLPREDGSDFYYLFDILPTSLLPGPNPAFAQSWIERNRRLFERARELGGTRYPIGAADFTIADWQAQYGARWPTVVKLKRRFDPANVLGRGIDMFAGA